jgi:sortase A
MSDESSMDDLTIEELEEILEAKRRARALERFRRVSSGEGTGVSSHLEATDAAAERPSRRGRYADSRRWSGAGSAQVSGERPVQSESGALNEGASFKAVEIVPQTGVIDKVTSVLGKLGRGLWLKGFPRLRDRLLLLLELAALAGLIFVVYSSLSELQVLNREVAEALDAEPEAVPAATTVTVLPGGSVPPGSEGTVPDQMRHLVEPGASIPIPTPGPRQASRIVIPSIDVDAPVVEGDGWEELKMGAGHRIGSVNPGERGNMVISGHNDVYGEIFRRLEDVNVGDDVVVYTGETPYLYVVVTKMIVEPTEVSLLEATPDATLTLITCHPYMIDSHRLVLIAELANQ